MEDKIIGKRSERDLSPSAYSQSSTGLEWDPSADVGTSANIQDEPATCTRVYQKHKGESKYNKSESDVSSVGTSTQTHDDASFRTRLTRSEIEYQKTRNKNKSDSELSSVGLSKTKRGDSLFCTALTRSEIEYQKKKDKAKSDSDTSSAGASTSIHRVAPSSSEMTRSEIQYQKKITKDKSDSDGSSVIWVEVLQTLGPRNPPESRNRVFKDIGIQTSNISEHPSELLDNTSFSNVFHSTPTDRFRSRIIRGREDSKAVRSEGDKDKVQKSKEKSRRREKSPPQPFAVASRRSSHRCHDAHHGRVGDQQHMSYSQLNESDKHTTASSSDLSASCYLIDKLVKTENLPVKKDDLLTLSAVEKHRDFHVKSVRHELKRLDKLNELFSCRLKMVHDHHFPKSLGKEEVVQKEKKNPIESNKQKKTSLPKRASPSKYKSGVKAKPVLPNPPTSDYSSTNTASTSTSSKDTTSRGTYTISEANSSNKICNTQRANNAQLKHLKETQALLKIKMEEYALSLKTFTEDFFGNKENIPEEADKKSKKRGKRKKIPVKTPVAYYINFATSNGQYVIEDEHLNLDKPIDNLKSNQTDSDFDIHAFKLHEGVQEKEEIKQVSDSEDEETKQGNCDGELLNEGTKRNKSRYTLQDAFQQRNPTFLNRVHDREEVLMRLKAERKLRAEKKREWIRKYSDNPYVGFNSLEKDLPPKGTRLMTTKEMRDLTAKKYKNLPEVKDKILQKKADEEKQTNRLMSQVFAQKLRQGVLKGEMNIVHSRSLIRR